MRARTESAFVLGRLSILAGARERWRERPEREREAIEGTKYRKLLLTLKPGVEQPFPLLRLWLDPDLNIVKRVGYAPSGRTLRSDYIRSYQRIKDPVSGELVYHYKEVLEVEEEEGTQMLLKYDEVVLQQLSPNMFTKSWLEQRAR